MNAVATAAAAPVGHEPMDREFIDQHQIVERYLLGKLPPRGVADFERVIRENPALIDQTGLSERVHRAVRLIEVSGQPELWAEKPRRLWEKPVFVATLGGALLIALIGVAVFSSRLSDAESRIQKLERVALERPIDPVSSRRVLTVVPSRTGPPAAPMFSMGSNGAELVEIKTDLSWSKDKAFRVEIGRSNQGMVALLHNVLKDSNGNLRMALNSTAFGPGTYNVSIEGLDWRGQPSPAAWASFEVVAHRSPR